MRLLLLIDAGAQAPEAQHGGADGRHGEPGEGVSDPRAPSGQDRQAHHAVARQHQQECARAHFPRVEAGDRIAARDPSGASLAISTVARMHFITLGTDLLLCTNDHQLKCRVFRSLRKTNLSSLFRAWRVEALRRAYQVWFSGILLRVIVVVLRPFCHADRCRSVRASSTRRCFPSPPRR